MQGQYTLAQLKISAGLSYQKILDCRIKGKAGEHGICEVLLEAGDATKGSQVNALIDGEGSVSLDGKILLKGVITQAGLSNENGYCRASLVIATKSILADKKKDSCVFQDPGKKLSDMVNHALSGTGLTAQYQKDISISHVVYRQDETPWQFIKRLAAQYKYQVYADLKSSSIAIGEVGFATYPESDLGEVKSVGKDISELRQVQSNQDSTAAAYAFETQTYVSKNISMAAGDHIGKETILEHLVTGEKGILINEIRVQKSSSSAPSYQSQAAPSIASGIVTGTVTAVDGNQIQVQFDANGGVGGGLTWIPYESVISNSFYCMPDVGDKAFIYYENNGKIICMGSKRSSDSHPDFDKPEEKVMTNHDKMIKFTTTGLNITATRELHDNDSDQEISIKMDDKDGITITSGQAIQISADQNIRLAAGEKKPDEHNELLKQGRDKFKQRNDAGASEYAADSGLDGAAAFLKATGTGLGNLGSDIKDSFVEGVQGMVFYDLWGGKGQEGEEKEEPEIIYETGVLSLYASEKLLLVTGESIIDLSTEITFSTPEFRWLGYDQTEHEQVEEQLHDWWETALDGLQLALDIAGFIPGIGDALDLVNAGISLARGDYFGAASSLVSAIPGVGSFIGGGAKALKAGGKAAKAVAKVTKVLSKYKKVIKAVEYFYSTVNLVATFIRNKDQIAEFYDKVKNGTFDWNNPADVQLLIGMGNLGVATAGHLKKTHDTFGKKKSKNKTGGDSDDGNNNKNKNGNNDGQDNQTCKYDPINVVTGSQTLVYTDFALTDITGNRYFKRTYESIYVNEGGLFGCRWMAEMESSVTRKDGLTIVQMPDMHLIRFRKTENGYENLMQGKQQYRLFDTEEGYVLKDHASGTSMYYRADGKLSHTEDGNHNRTEYIYEDGVPKRIEYPGGQFLNFTLEHGKITEITDILGRKLTYEYEGDFLTKATLANGGSIRYEYTPEGYIRSVTDQNGRTYVVNHYDRKGRVVRQELSNGEEYVMFYDDGAKKNTFVTTATGNRITYSYGKEKLPTITSYEDGTWEEKRYDEWHNVIYERDRNGGETSRLYDREGNLLEETLPNGLKTEFTYNEAGKMLTCKDNAGREEFYEYDPAGNMTRKSRRLDSRTMQTYAYAYDSAGRLVRETDPEGNETAYAYQTGFALYSSMRNAEGTEIRYAYDKAGRNMAVENEFGSLRYGYNDADFVTKEEDEEGNETRYDYDRMCNLIRKTSPGHKGSGALRDQATRYEYDDLDRLVRETSPMGRVKAYENDSEGNVTKEVNPNCYDPATKDGTGIIHQYDHDGNRIRTIYPEGETECFRYDPEGNLTEYIRPEAYAKDGEAARGTRYTYDEVGRLTGIRNEEGVMEHAFVYDLCGNIIKEIDAKGYELGDTDEERIGTLYIYNLAGWMLEKREPVKISRGAGNDSPGNESGMDEGSRSEASSDKGNRDETGKSRGSSDKVNREISYRLTTYEYDKNGNLTKEKRFLDYQSGTSRNGRIHVISYEYDKISRITRITDTTGAELRYTYNSRNALTSIKEKMEEGKWREMHYFYRSNGRLERVAETADKEGCGKGYAQTRYEYDPEGNVVRITTPSGNEILREYDADGLLVKEEHKENRGDIENCFTYEYDKAGNLTKVTDVFGVPVSYEYDVRNRLISMTGKNGGITKLIYDRNSRVERMALPKEYNEKGNGAKGYCYSYDALDRIISMTGPDGTLIYKRSYNPYGELEQETDNAGSGIRFVYDYIGRKIHVSTAGQAEERYEYDPLGNLIATTDGNGNRTNFSVDAWGRIQEILKADSSKETYEYDFAGNMIKATDGEGHQIKYDYNTAGNLSSRTDASGNTEYFYYDIEGRLCRHRDRNGSETTYAYNMYHDPVRREHKTSGLQEAYGYRKDGSLAYAIGGGMRYDYTYYLDGSLHEKKASGKTLLSFQYDLNGNRTLQRDITGKETRYTYNALDLLEEVRDNGFSARYSYHGNGTIKSLSVGDRLTTHYEYDRDKNLTRQWTRMKGEVEEGKRSRFSIPVMDKDGMTLLADYRYSYDGNGNRTSKESLAGKTSYQYDSLNRLVKVQYPKGLEEFSYDRADNRIKKLTEKEEELYKYDVCNRMVEKQIRKLGAGRKLDSKTEMSTSPGNELNLDNTGTTAPKRTKEMETRTQAAIGKPDSIIPFCTFIFQYDNQGNLLREERKTEGNSQESIYSYDGFNRQKKIINFEDKVQVNHYDGEGLRHEMEENGKLVKFLYNDRKAVVEEKEDGNTIRLIRGYNLVASDSESARIYYHYVSDEQGSITHVLGGDGNGSYGLRNYYEYGAFGDFREKEEEVENRFGYNGEIFDPIGGQYYLRARYYNPVIGRFTQEDTYYGDGLNLYAYCRNLPIGYVDPSGYYPCQEKQDLYKKYREQGMTAQDANRMANYELIRKNQGIDAAEKYLQNEKNKSLGYYQDSTGRWHRPDGKFASNAEVGLPSNSDHYLNRPYIRQATIDAVNASTKVDYKTGQIYDSISDKWVDPSNVELGHTTGNEFAYYRDWAESQGMTQQQFNDFMNNPDFYAWQDIYSNRSHKFEEKH